MATSTEIDPLYMRVATQIETGADPIALQVPDLGTAKYFWDAYMATFSQRESVFDIVDGFPGIPIEKVPCMVPDENWYISREHAFSIHGRQHSFRVGVYAEILAWKMDLTERQKDTLRAAALLHDIGRIQDFPDPEHGARSAIRWRELEEKEDILAKRGIQLDEEQRKTVEVLCVNHEKLYGDIDKNVKADEETHMLLKIFMAADALDRYRSPNTKWWPDPQFFEHDPEIQELFIAMMPLTRHFTLWTEYFRLDHHSLSLEEAFIKGDQESEHRLIREDGDLSIDKLNRRS